jgi:hypothetical protein
MMKNLESIIYNEYRFLFYVMFWFIKEDLLVGFVLCFEGSVTEPCFSVLWFSCCVSALMLFCLYWFTLFD